jgi:hypothetical protein
LYACFKVVSSFVNTLFNRPLRFCLYICKSNNNSNMKRFLLLFVLACGSTVAMQAQESTAPPTTEVTEEVVADGPQMTFESLEIDFGTIEQDSDPFRIFKFKNTGTDALLITNARGSCGCTVPSYSKAPVEAGADSEVKVRYDTHRLGQFRKRVTLTTNAGDEPIILTIKGKVEPKPAEPAAVPAGEQGIFNGGGK